MFQRTGAAVIVVLIALAGSLGTAAAQYQPPQSIVAEQAPPYDPPAGYGRPDDGYAQPQSYDLPGGQIESHALPPPPGSYSNPPPPPSGPYADQPAAGPYGNQAPTASYGNPPAPANYGSSDPRYQRPDYAVRQPEPAVQQQPQSRGFLPNPFEVFRPPAPIGPQEQQQAAPAATVASLPPEDQPETGPVKQLPPRFRRTMVDYRTKEPAGTIIIDTPNTYLYLVLGNGKAMRYGIGVGREGFTWAGTERISRMAEWPDWHPPVEMIERQPYLPRFMAGGEGNPLGARALYLGNTLYRIHGTNQPSTIGTFVSSGCIRLTNEDISDLYTRVQVGNRVVVLPGGKPPATASAAPQMEAAGPYTPIAPRVR